MYYGWAELYKVEKNAKYHQMRMPERDNRHKLEGDGEMEIYSIKKKINDKDKKRKYPTTIQRLTTRFESNRAPLPNHILNTHARLYVLYMWYREWERDSNKKRKIIPNERSNNAAKHFIEIYIH